MGPLHQQVGPQGVLYPAQSGSGKLCVNEETIETDTQKLGSGGFASFDGPPPPPTKPRKSITENLLQRRRPKVLWVGGLSLEGAVPGCSHSGGGSCGCWFLHILLISTSHQQKALLFPQAFSLDLRPGAWLRSCKQYTFTADSSYPCSFLPLLLTR